MTLILFDVVLTSNSPFRAPGEESTYALCVIALKPFIVELCFIRHKIGKRIYFLMI